MLESAGSLVGEVAKGFVVGARKLDKGELGDESEHLFEKIDERVGQQCEHGVEEEDGEMPQVEVAEGGVLRKQSGDVNQ